MRFLMRASGIFWVQFPGTINTTVFLKIFIRINQLVVFNASYDKSTFKGQGVKIFINRMATSIVLRFSIYLVFCTWAFYVIFLDKKHTQTQEQISAFINVNINFGLPTVTHGQHE